MNVEGEHFQLVNAKQGFFDLSLLQGMFVMSKWQLSVILWNKHYNPKHSFKIDFMALLHFLTMLGQINFVEVFMQKYLRKFCYVK